MNLSVASAIIAGALDAAEMDGLPPLTVVVLDDAGNLVAAQRQDGASMFRFDIAFGKAWAAVAMGVTSRALAERARDNPVFMTALASTASGRFLPQPGAVIVWSSEGRIIGSVGASGGTGDQDEEACVRGVEAAGLSADLR